MPQPDFEFVDTINPEKDLEMSSVSEILQKVNQMNFTDVNFGAIRPGAGSVIDGDLLVEGSITAEKIKAGTLTLENLSGSLDDIEDGTTYKRALQTELTGGSRAYSGLNSSSEIIKGYLTSSLSSKTLPYTGVRIDSNGIYGRKSGSTTFYINSNGDATFSGDVISSTVTGSTITGGTVRTSTSSTRVEMSSSGNGLSVLQNGATRVFLGEGNAQFYHTNGAFAGIVYGAGSGLIAMSNGTGSASARMTLGSSYLDLVNTDLRLECDLLARWNGSYDLGKSATRFRDLWLSRDLAFGGRVRNNMVPNTTGYDIGSSSTRWSVVYCTVLSESSDRDLKKSIKVSDYGLKEILNLKPVQFEWKKGKGEEGLQVGFIADEVKKIMPEVASDVDLKPTRLLPVLVKAIQELNKELQDLKNKV